MPGLVTCHFCVFAVCGNVPVEKALTILMLLISQHLTVVFSSLCFGMRLRKTLSVCVRVCARTCVCAHTPSHLVTSDAAVGSLHCQENPRLAGMLNAYAHTHTTLRTRKCFYTRELHICRRTQAHTLLPFHTLALNLFHYFTASSITVATKPTWPLLTPM